MIPPDMMMGGGSGMLYQLDSFLHGESFQHSMMR